MPTPILFDDPTREVPDHELHALVRHPLAGGSQESIPIPIEIDMDEVILPPRRMADPTVTRVDDRPGPLGAVIAFALVAATFWIGMMLAM